MMVTERTVVVAIEDYSTANCVCEEAAHVAADCTCTRIVLLHVLDQHPLSGAAIAISGYYMPLVESDEDGAAILGHAERIIREQFQRLQAPVPALELLVGHGNPARTIENVVKDFAAEEVVLGARHRHVLGGLIFTDVRAHLKCPNATHVHIAPL